LCDYRATDGKVHNFLTDYSHRVDQEAQEGFYMKSMFSLKCQWRQKILFQSQEMNDVQVSNKMAPSCYSRYVCGLGQHKRLGENVNSTNYEVPQYAVSLSKYYSLSKKIFIQK
jgi:hypothetical protein